jgi:hypothetical protein
MFDSIGGRHRLHAIQRPVLECPALGCHADAAEGAPVPLCQQHLRVAFAYVLETERPDLSAASEAMPYWVTDPNPTGFVYFVRIDALIKIGFSRNPKQRFAKLTPDEVLHLEPGTMRDERRCHAAFAHARAYGEMFYPSEDLLAFIEDLRTAAA